MTVKNSTKSVEFGPWTGSLLWEKRRKILNYNCPALSYRPIGYFISKNLKELEYTSIFQPFHIGQWFTFSYRPMDYFPRPTLSFRPTNYFFLQKSQNETCRIRCVFLLEVQLEHFFQFLYFLINKWPESHSAVGVITCFRKVNPLISRLCTAVLSPLQTFR